MKLTPLDQTVHGYAALHWACMHACDSSTRSLLEGGARKNIRTREGHETPLMKAAQANAPACIALLRAHNAAFNARDKAGRTALHFAAKIGSVPCVIELLVAGAAVHLPDDPSGPGARARDDAPPPGARGRTAIEYAAATHPGADPRMERSLRVVRLLAAHGARMEGLEELLAQAVAEEKSRRGPLGALGVPLRALDALGVATFALEDEDEVCRAHSAVSERLFHPHKTRERSKRRGAYSRMRAWRQYDDEHAEDIHAGHPISIA